MIRNSSHLGSQHFVLQISPPHRLTEALSTMSSGFSYVRHLCLLKNTYYLIIVSLALQEYTPVGIGNQGTTSHRAPRPRPVRRSVPLFFNSARIFLIS